MERDFMGIGRMDGLAAAAAKDGTRGRCKDAAFISSPTLQRPYPSKASSMQQQHASCKVAQDDRIRMKSFDQVPHSGYLPISPKPLAFDAIQRPSSSMFLSQKNFNMDGQVARPVPIANYSSQGAAAFSTLVHCSNDGGVFPVYPKHPIPVESLYLDKAHKAVTRSNVYSTSLMQQQRFGGNSAVCPPIVGSKNSAFPERISTRAPPTAHLTIFYGGMVNVYDNVTLEKAQTIMFLAENGSNFSSNAADSTNEMPLLAPVKMMPMESVPINQNTPKINQNTPKTNLSSSPCSGFSSPVASHSATHSTSGSSTRDEMKLQKTAAFSAQKILDKPLNSAAQDFAPSASGSTPMTRAVPMARKATLARFLEKRKERFTNAAPYMAKISPESSVGFDATTSSSEKSAAGCKVPLSGSMDRSWHPSTLKYGHDVRFPNTKLEI